MRIDRKSDRERRKRIAARRVLAERLARNMEQTEFAEFIGLPKNAQYLISKWEMGKTLPEPGDARMLSDATGREFGWFLGEDERPVVYQGGTSAIYRVVGDIIPGKLQERPIRKAEDQEYAPVHGKFSDNVARRIFVVRGGKLEPDYRPGMLVVVSDRKPKNGEHVVASFSTEDGFEVVVCKFRHTRGRNIISRLDDPVSEFTLSEDKVDRKVSGIEVLGAIDQRVEYASGTHEF